MCLFRIVMVAANQYSLEQKFLFLSAVSFAPGSISWCRVLFPYNHPRHGDNYTSVNSILIISYAMERSGRFLGDPTIQKIYPRVGAAASAAADPPLCLNDAE